MQLSTDRLIEGRYRLLGLIGRGGMAQVYRVQHLQLGTYHALKVLTLTGGHDASRLLREGRVQGGLRHPNVVTVFDYGVDGDLQYVVMEKLGGERLSDRIARGPMSGKEVAAIGAGIARGLRHAPQP